MSWQMLASTLVEDQHMREHSIQSLYEQSWQILSETTFPLAKKQINGIGSYDILANPIYQ